MIFENVAKAAAEKGVSIGAIEKECGLGNGTIGKWRTVSPSVATLKKVAEYLGVGIEILIDGKKEEATA